MKRTRRLFVEIEHRKITFSLTRTGVPEAHVSTVGKTGSPDGLDSVPPVCPDCGSPWITVMAHAGEDAAPSAVSIHRVVGQSGLHVHVTASGQLRICSRSFEEIKESF